MNLVTDRPAGLTATESGRTRSAIAAVSSVADVHGPMTVSAERRRTVVLREACERLADRLHGMDGFEGVTVTESGYVRARVRMNRIVAEADAMEEVAVSGRVSETPDAPVLLCARADDSGRFELSDGHHRAVAAIRAGRSWMDAVIDPFPDDEPLSEPFYRFPGCR